MKKVSSVVWQFFDRLEENKRCVAVLCKLCDSQYKYFGNTTNLRVHLIKKHPIQWEFRQNPCDSQKLDDSNLRNIFEDEDSTVHSPIKRRKRVHEDKNVRYSLSVKKPNNGSAGEDSMPRIEIQRVDVVDTKLDEDIDDNEDDEATSNLVRQMHNQASDEEWLDEDYQHVEIYEPKRKKSQYTRIKQEVNSPPRRASTYIVRNTAKRDKPDQFIYEDTRKDEYTVFGEYIANKLRKFKAPRTRGNIQQLITTILWQAEYGMFDDAEAVKRVLMSTVGGNIIEQPTVQQPEQTEPEQPQPPQQPEPEVEAETEMGTDEQSEANQSVESES